MKNSVVIVGAGGHAKVVCDIILKNHHGVAGFLDDYKSENDMIFGYPILGRISQWKDFQKEHQFIVAIGDNKTRKRIVEMLKVQWYTAVHPHASIGLNTTIGAGTAVMAGAVINADAQVGNHVIINSQSVVEHDCRIGDYSHISPNAVLAGRVCIGECVHIGAGAAVKDGINIVSDVIVGLGAAVVKELDRSGVYIGVPARKL